MDDERLFFQILQVRIHPEPSRESAGWFHAAVVTGPVPVIPAGAQRRGRESTHRRTAEDPFPVLRPLTTRRAPWGSCGNVPRSARFPSSIRKFMAC